VRGKATDWLVYGLVRVFICVIQSVRIETCQTWARGLSFFCAEVVGVRRNLVEANLRSAFPNSSAEDRKRLTREMWEHLVLLICEVAHAPRVIRETNWRDYIKTVKKKELVSALIDVRPAIVVSGHFGNFEMASYSAGLLGLPTHAIARPLDNKLLNDYILNFRSASGQYMLPKEGSAEQIQSLLQSGGALALLADQHGGEKGCWVEFFGRLASHHKALALFSLTTDAPMLVAYAKRMGRPLHFEVGVTDVFDPLLEEAGGVKPLTEWYSQQLETIIRTAPGQYWWLHRRWREPPERILRRWRKDHPESLGAPVMAAKQAASVQRTGSQDDTKRRRMK